MQSFKKFETNDNQITHLAFKGKGKYYVKKDDTNEFYLMYYNAIKNRESLYFIEKINKGDKFYFFLDIDSKEINKEIIYDLVQQIFKYIGNESEYFISSRVCDDNEKFHVNFPEILVNTDKALEICSKIDSNQYIDTSVYKTGLRMYGSKKANDTNCNTVYSLINNQVIISFKEFLKLCIRPIEGNCNESSDIETLENENTEQIQYNDNIEKIITVLKDSTYFEKYLLDISNIKELNDTIFITIKDRLCPFVQREHKRTCDYLYILYNKETSTCQLRCYNEECKSKFYPEEKIKISKITDPGLIKLLRKGLNGSHFNISKILCYLYKNTFRVDSTKNTEWYYYQDYKWVKSLKIYSVITDVLVSNYILFKDKNNEKNINKLIFNLQTNSFKNSVLNESVYQFKQIEPEFINKLDANPYLMGFTNGVFDFKNCQFRKIQPIDYLSLNCNFDYKEHDEKSNDFNEMFSFLQTIITNNKVLEYLLNVLAKSLVGIPDEKFYILTGLSGANGKSTLINFLEYSLGDYITTADITLLTTKKTGSSNATPDIIRLKGKRIITFGEPEYGDTLKTSLIKSFSGGDSIIARELYKAPVSFKIQGSMFMCCNDLPNISSIDGGTFRRLRVIEFKSRFVDNPHKRNEFKIDPTIKDKIKNWAPLMISFLINLYIKNKDKPLEEPEDVLLATNRYKTDNDKFNDYFSECLVENNDNFETLKTIYNHFCRWYLENSIGNSNKIPNMKELKKSLKIKYGDETFLETEDNLKIEGFNVKFI